ncbi:DUF4142 domain-containing protein [Sphingomonas bacterium]|uniref:DUF4142 domain-containing protein n=1 Tax=Sphingomonas bacterium TaxID=1895847 RepID=UPI0015755BD6|nr:DUF4142 domain-containing protein [Sphingomonas bacterium]
MKTLTIALALATTACLCVPAMAQDTAATTGMMTASDVGVAPLTGTSATDYVKMAADSDNYETQASKLALSKSKDAGIKAYAKEMIADHGQTSKALMAALKNGDRTITAPGMTLSAENANNIALLKGAPKGSFDALFVQQQITAHQKAWALHKGYATDGTDPALKQVASTAVPIVEGHLSHVKTLAPAAS